MKLYQAKDYQLNCQLQFEKHKVQILKCLPIAQVEHIGASSIPGCVSKGDLDIYVGVDDVSQSVALIESMGFKIKQETLRTNQLCMLESLQDKEVAIQLVGKNTKFESFLTFRDLLLGNANLVSEYNKMKLSCLGFSEDKYREAKSKFIEKLLYISNR
jgi:GrpB-like predicted nucleotidyltransferase (UPF0157 family)